MAGHETTQMTKNMYRFAMTSFAFSGVVFCAMGLLRSDLLFGGVGLSFLGTAGMYFFLERSTAGNGAKAAPKGAAQQVDATDEAGPRP